MEGPIDKTVDIEFLDGKDHRVKLKLSRARPRGTETVFGMLPPVHFWVDTHKVGDVGYIRFNMFFQPDAVANAVQKLMSDCHDCKGFVIDLRGNPGGVGGMAMGLAGWFTSEKGLRLGTMYLRTTKINFAVFPRPEPFMGPLAILVDGCSASTSEIFAGGMQDLKRAHIFGTAYGRRGAAFHVHQASQRRWISVRHRELHFSRRQASRGSRRNSRSGSETHPSSAARGTRPGAGRCGKLDSRALRIEVLE